MIASLQTDPSPIDIAAESPSSGELLNRSLLKGMLGFTGVSLGGFAVWAFAGRWFYRNTGEAGLYLVSTFVFLALSGLFLHSLVLGSGSVKRFYRIFVPAFFAYAFVWSICWFLGRFGAGEWLGSFFGCFAFVLLVRSGFHSRQNWIKPVLFLFVLHSAGYFLGGVAMSQLNGPAGPKLLAFLSKPQIGTVAKMLWGLFYGLGFGAGIGYVFHQLQIPAAASAPPFPARTCV